MRLVISRGTFALEDVPSAVDLSDVRISRRVSWDRRRRRLTWGLVDAGRVREELDLRGVRLGDVEVRAAVQGALEDDPVEGPASVAAFGDVRAIAELGRALDAYQPCADCAVCDYLAVLGLGTAIQVLGGSPTESQQRKIVDYELRQRFAWSWAGAEEANRTALAEAAPLAVAAPAPRERLGRNAPCHCGSGKKYKLCHLELDLARPDETRH
jgi:hypothetical protein